MHTSEHLAWLWDHVAWAWYTRCGRYRVTLAPGSSSSWRALFGQVLLPADSPGQADCKRTCEEHSASAMGGP